MAAIAVSIASLRLQSVRAATLRCPTSTRSNQTMIRSEIERAVSRATGESRRTIRAYGFSLLTEEPESFYDPLLVLDCPGCGVPLDAANFSTGVLKFVECPRCDAVYPFADDEIYVANGPKTAL